MGDNGAITNNLTAAYNGSYLQGVNISSKDLASNLVYTGDLGCIKAEWDYGITLNEDCVKKIVEQITKEKELARLTPDVGPEIPKWVGFLPI